MNLDPTALGALGIGAIAAAAGAFWGQLRGAFAYVSSFVVVSATFDTALTPIIRLHLKTNWRPLPSGLLLYSIRWLRLAGRPHTTPVPFRQVSHSAVYVGGLKFLMVSGSSSMTVMAPRGMMRFDRFVSGALDNYEKFRHQPDPVLVSSRFQVWQRMGSEKTPSRGSSELAAGEHHQEGASASTSGSNETFPDVEFGVDTSFKYGRDEYAGNRGSDPFEFLFFEPSVTRYVEAAVRWKDMAEWYEERGIPWRKGWLLTGEGGTGKSSFTRALAMKLEIPIYQYHLATFSDQEFVREWRCMGTPCIALLEDFDAIFKGRVATMAHGLLTFDCVLNVISGVDSASGVFLILTTNNPDDIDAAMGKKGGGDGEISTRPGRLDTVIEFGVMGEANRRRMASKILKDWPWAIESAIARGAGSTPAQFQERCVQFAGAIMAFDEECERNEPGADRPDRRVSYGLSLLSERQQKGDERQDEEE